MKTIIFILFLMSFGFSDWQNSMNKTEIDNGKFIRYYDKATHIVCYVYNYGERKMQCFDVNNERLKLKCEDKEEEEKPKQPTYTYENNNDEY